VRVYAGLVSLLLIGATLSPLRHDPRRAGSDDFPLSTYPMFAWPRPTRLTLDYVVGWTAAGERWHVPPSAIGSSEVLQAKRLVERAVAGGPEAMAELCARVAARVRARRDDIVAVAIVTGTHDALAVLERGALGPERERARCAVVR
jgi:hypothetical protein